MTPKLKPVEGKIVLKFLDEETDEERMKRHVAHPGAVEHEPEKAEFAQVIAVGPKVAAKAGDVVLVRPWARDGLDVGDGQVLTDGFAVMAIVSK